MSRTRWPTCAVGMCACAEGDAVRLVRGAREGPRLVRGALAQGPFRPEFLIWRAYPSLPLRFRPYFFKSRALDLGVAAVYLDSRAKMTTVEPTLGALRLELERKLL